MAAKDHAGQGQPTRNKPNTPSLWNPEISAWAVRQGESPDSKLFTFLHSVLLCSAVFAWIYCPLSVHCHSSHPFPSICELPLTLKSWNLVCIWTCLRTLTQIIWVTLMPAALRMAGVLCPGEDISRLGNVSVVMDPIGFPVTDPSQRCPVSPGPDD